MSHRYTDEGDESVRHYPGEIFISAGCIRVLRRLARAWHSERMPIVTTRCLEIFVKLWQPKVVFVRPTGRQLLAIRDIGMVHHPHQDPRKCYTACTLYFRAPRAQQMRHVLYGNLTLDPAGNIETRGGIRLAPDTAR